MGRKAVPAFLALLLLSVGPAWAAPSGRALAVPATEALFAAWTGTGYRSPMPERNPQPKFDITGAPKGGVCFIRGTGRLYPRDSYGINVRSEFDRLKRQLSEAYGPPTEIVDQLQAGAYWTEAEAWVHALWRKERVYEVKWAAQPAAPLKDSVFEIVLAVRAINTDASYLSLQYRFVGYTACDRPQGVADASVPRSN